MKILIVTFRYPFPEVGGEYVRINNIARYLKRQGHEVILLSLFNPKESSRETDNDLYAKTFFSYRISIFSYIYTFFAVLLGPPLQIGYFFSFLFLFKLISILRREKPDKIILHTIRTTQYFFLLKRSSNVIVEATDALSKTYSQCKKNFSWKSFNFMQFLYGIEQRRIKKYEKKVTSFFPKTIFVSDNDVEYVGACSTIECKPNGVDVFPSRAKPDPNKIVFVGNMRSLQNEDAAIYFIEEVFPLIQKTNQQAVFYIVGANPSQKLKKLSKTHANIVVTGYVDNIDLFIEDAAVSVAPIRYAAGIQNKILVSLAHHLPVVISPLIAKGIPELKDNFNCFICSDPDGFASCCLKCIERTKEIELIEENGYNTVKTNYSWDSKLSGYLD